MVFDCTRSWRRVPQVSTTSGLILRGIGTAAVCGQGVGARRANHLPKPRVAKRVGGRGRKAPDYSRDVGAARPGERRREKWSREGCVACVARYLESATGRSTRSGYADWASAQERAPALGTIEMHGGWKVMHRLAQERVRDAPPST